MSLRMLIDARHPEETRVAVVNGQRIEEFDFEAADRKQLKGNIYLAKVTRVEPSLQAAFVEYGGNRHGFLAFSEIHPDYYQIPREDREALLREEAEFASDHDGEHDGDHDAERDEHAEDDGGDERSESTGELAETGGQHDEPTDALRRKRQSLRRRYKIQEVIRRRQVLLIQVVKEERGSKGAALTTYLSLAGRYCVLMPNTAHGGGISRKISNLADRRRLKTIMADLKLPAGMGAIVRTAGLKRSSEDIRRDFDYLTRLWDEIREKTLSSSAPALIHQDSDLIKRAVRDIYHRDIEQVLVEGAEGFADASRFMAMLMPGHGPKVVEYSDNVPLFQRFGVEAQLEGMYQPVVQLKSGGYIVINPTEALVSIDVNSGRSTREYGIEETATKTNLEAADEVGRQLRLRDMAGLVVIDFIDMEVSANVRRVERQMKDALKNDRARVQIGRISAFGLMEMSRQRLRTGILEASTHICPMCEGTGMVRSVASAALAALRALEAEALRGRTSEFTLRAGEEVAVYILNRKRIELAELEELYGVTIVTVPDESLIGPNFIVDANGPPPTKKVEMRALPAPVRIEDDPDDIEEDFDDEGEEGEARPPRAAADRAPRAEGSERSGRNKRRRRGRGRDKDDARPDDARPDDARPDETRAADGEVSAEAAASADVDAATDGGAGGSETRGERERGDRKRRRRGRRGGKREGGRDDAGSDVGIEASADAPVDEAAAPSRVTAVANVENVVVDDSRARRAPRRRKAAAVDGAAPEPVEVVAAEAVTEQPARKPRRAAAVVVESAPVDAATLEKPKRAPRKAKADVAPALPAAAEPAAAAKSSKAPAKAKAAAARKPSVKSTGAAAEKVVAKAVVKPTAKVAAAKTAPVKPAQVKAEPAKAARTETRAGSPANAAAIAPAAVETAKAPDVAAASESGLPTRKGWWQRTFG